MSVMGLLMPVAGLIKARYRGEKAEIDSPFFKLHYRTTSTLPNLTDQQQEAAVSDQVLKPTQKPL